MSLAKYLFIVAREDDPGLDIHDVAAFFRHVLERVDWANDLHFQTRTTIDTLDYSGHGLNQGSKVVVAAAGPAAPRAADRARRPAPAARRLPLAPRRAAGRPGRRGAGLPGRRRLDPAVLRVGPARTTRSGRSR